MPAPTSITFFYPSRIIGGAEYLFIRMARYLAAHTDIRIYVVDYPDGFLRKQLEGSPVRIIDFNVTENLLIDFNTVIVTPLNHLLDISRFRINADVSVFFWSIHPTHFTAFFENRKWFIGKNQYERISHALITIIGKGGMAFMDDPNYYTNDALLSLNLNQIPYLPIACNPYDGDKKRFKPGKEITIAWVGRIAMDKVGAIINMAGHIMRLPDYLREQVHFVIIGNGEEEKRLADALKEIKIKYTRKGTVINENLNDYLLQEVDIGFAMGTSALEFAKLKIPVVLADVFMDDIPADNKFQWLYDTRGFSLGETYRPGEGRIHTLVNIMNVCNNEELYHAEAERCYRYYNENFEITAIASKLLEYLSENQVRIKSPEVSVISSIMNPWFFLILKKLKSYLQ